MHRPHTPVAQRFTVRHKLCLMHKRTTLMHASTTARIDILSTRFEDHLGPCTQGTCSMRAQFLVVARYA